MDDHFCVISLSFEFKNPINNLQCNYYNWGHLIIVVVVVVVVVFMIC